MQKFSGTDRWIWMISILLHKKTLREIFLISPRFAGNKNAIPQTNLLLSNYQQMTHVCLYLNLK